MTDPVVMPVNDDDDIALWSNLLALRGTHFPEHGMPRQNVLDKLAMGYGTNEETIRSPRAREAGGRAVADAGLSGAGRSLNIVRPQGRTAAARGPGDNRSAR